ncbi:MAG TPA: DUF3048 domain-containing protein [Chloroflexota bacterium]|nr:DUF3048 domain-containing protein [Chloroflexota bacterium]
MKRVLLILVLLAAIAAGGLIAYGRLHRPSAALAGTSGSAANVRPVAVTIDNYLAARPQDGLSEADIVFETLAEGGITRFLAVFQSQAPATVGPVRSTRYYFNAWAAMIGAIFGHDGGNVDALQELPSLTTIYNEDADRMVGPFWRVSSRVAPYNEYTSVAGLRSYAAQHGSSITGSRWSIPHKNPASPSGRGPQSTINIQFSYADYNVSWTYNPATNLYARVMGGSPHIDVLTGKQITAANVVVMFTDETSAPDPYTPGAIHMRTEGSGQAIVYRDGHVTPGTWQKNGVDGPLQWFDKNGNQIALNPGPTWIEVVPKGNTVTPTS